MEPQFRKNELNVGFNQWGVTWTQCQSSSNRSGQVQRTSRSVRVGISTKALYPRSLTLGFLQGLQYAILTSEEVLTISTYHRMSLLQHLVDSDEGLKRLHLIREDRLYP